MAKACHSFKTGGINFYEIVNFVKTCLQVNAFVRLEKMTLPENVLPTPCLKKDISLYTDNTGLVQPLDKIVVRFTHTIYPYSFGVLQRFQSFYVG
jgi:hypothetical protein